MENCQINIVKDLSVRPTVSLPENMQVGDTITPTVTNLIDGVDIAKVFKYTWKNGNSSQVYNGAATPTLTAKGTLKLNLAAKKPYVMCSSSGSYGSIDASGTVAAKLLDVVYVDAANGNDSNMGDSTAAAVKNLGTAADKMKDGGTIVLCGDYLRFHGIHRKECDDQKCRGESGETGAVRFQRPDDRRRRERDPGSY